MTRARKIFKLLPGSALLGSLLLAQAAAPAAVLALEEGHHLHVIAHNAPVENYIPQRGPQTLDVEIILHDQPAGGAGKEGFVDWLELQDCSTSCVQRAIVRDLDPATAGTQKVGPCATTCSARLPLRFDTSSWTCGRHELRIRANIPNTFEGNRQFTTSRLFWNVAGCSTDRSGRTGWYGGGGSWYEGVNYAIAVQLSPSSTLRPGGTTKWRVQSDAVDGCVFANPNAHGGSMGRQLAACGTIPDSSAGRQVTIPSDLADGDRIAVVSRNSTRQHAGLYVRRLDSSPGTTMWVEWQSWWNTAGLVIP